MVLCSKTNRKAAVATTVYSGYSGHVYSVHSDIYGHFSQYKIHLSYYIQVRYSGQSDIVARIGWPKVATTSEVHCIAQVDYHCLVPVYYLPPKVARGAYFHGRDVFCAMKYFSEYTYLALY